jgi:AcrR family transcriptional regulator
MARKGTDATAIQEITDAADVGFGSFYNHFASKEAIVDAVMDDALETFGDALDRIADSVQDPAEVFAASVRHLLRKIAEDESWGWFLVRTGFTRMDAVGRGLGRRMARDIATGIAAGRFKVADGPAVVLAAGGVVLAMIAGRLHGTLGDDAPERAAGIVLQLLGLTAKDAAKVATRPLPDVRIPS